MLKDPDQGLPEHITVRTPTLDETKRWTCGLPFDKIEEFLQIVDMGTRVNITSDLGNSKIWDLATLKSALPQSMTEEGPSGASVDLSSTHEDATPLHRQIMFSLANNYAGLEDVSIGKVFSFLQKTTNQGTFQKLLQLMRGDPNYSSRAIALSIFQGALELGDARLIDLLLNNKALAIDVNRLSCQRGGHKYTPIERASTLRHKDVINVLLKHGSDVSLTYMKQENFHGPEGALNCAIRPFNSMTYTRVDPQIFQMLLDAGGAPSGDTLDLLIKERDEESFGLLLSANKNATKWMELGIFSHAISRLSDQTAMATIRTMIDAGVDLNLCRFSGRYIITDSSLGSGFDRDNVLDTAARRGNLEMTELLLESGASMTNETLTLAISSASHEVIRMLLDRGADVNGYCSYDRDYTTPLAEAIRLQDRETIELLQMSNRFRLDDRIQFSAAIIAASEVGDIALVDRLIQLQLEGQPRANEMGKALAIAIRKGQGKAVALLLEAGADLNTSGFGSHTPLREAISQHNAPLVHLLLEEGALPDGAKELDKAVKWGDLSVVNALILAGADADHVLSAAVKSGDQALVQLLLDAGAHVNNQNRSYNAVQAALKNEDISMACYLLDRGAEPADTPLLGLAMAERPEFFEFVLKKHRMRYPGFPAKFGCNALTSAVRLKDKHVIRTMLERGLDAGSLIEDGDGRYSPFGRAIYDSTVDVIELFLQKRCDPNGIVYEISRRHNQATCYRLTGLLAAIETRNVVKVELLHRYGAKVNFPTHTRVKRTPLQEAAAAGSTDIVEFLLKRGAEVNAPAARRDGGTALQFAAIGAHIPVACQLIDAGADVDASASRVNGRTALEGAAEHGRLDMLMVLLNAGAGDGGRDQGQFERAMALARDQGHDYIADFLEDYLRPKRQEIGIEPMDPQMEEEGAAQHGRLDMLQLPSNAGPGDQDFNFSTDLLDDHLQHTQREDGHWTPTSRTEYDFHMYDYNGENELMDVSEIDRVWQEHSSSSEDNVAN